MVQIQREDVRRRPIMQQKNSKDYQNNSDIHNDRIPDELSPIHKLLYKESAKKYHESYLYEVPMLNSKLNSNLVLEGSKSNKWRFFYHNTNIVQKFDYVRENNYSNNNIINIKSRVPKQGTN